MVNKKSYLAMSAVVVVAISLAAAPQVRNQNQTEAFKLMNERQAVLQKILDVERRRFELGQSTIEKVTVAERELLDARLELATTKRDRIKIREAALKLSEERESQIAKRADQGELSPDAVLKAKSIRLRAEIDLHLEKRSP